MVLRIIHLRNCVECENTCDCDPMDVKYEIPIEHTGEVGAVLQGIAWPTKPDEILITARLAGGRSASDVLEAVVRTGNQRSRKVIKLGPMHELKGEFRAFQDHLQHASRFFVPIEAVTPALQEENPGPQAERQAVVYDHASRFAGAHDVRAQTFEKFAADAVTKGGRDLEYAISAIRKLFQGVRNDLYDRFESREMALREDWNSRLGDDATVAVDKVQGKSLVAQPCAGGKVLYPLDVADAALSLDGKDLLGAVVKLPAARMEWWGNRLMAEVKANCLRVEIKLEGGKSIPDWKRAVKEDSIWRIEGRLTGLRSIKHHKVIAKTLQGVPDPFASLASVLNTSRRDRVVSLVHGDLNPRNILLVGGEPCLIDYALTRPGEPIFVDFTRLEGCLTRDVLPADLTWAQHVRLQRLLAWAGCLGDEAAVEFARRLGAERPELGYAFELLWAIRSAGRDSYPKELRDGWRREYLEQLFLFAHLTLKWDEQPDSKLRATAAMAGVAAEALAPETSFEHWSEANLRDDGVAVMEFMRRKRQFEVPAMASFARRVTPLVKKKDDPLQVTFDGARADFVRGEFGDRARKILLDLREDHDVYVNLRAFIELKGELTAGRAERPDAVSMEDILADLELFAERERLRSESKGQDALRLIAENAALVLLGDAGAGKSTVAREWEYRLARSLVESESDPAKDIAAVPRLPMIVRASDVAQRLERWIEDEPKTAGTVLEDTSPHHLAIGAVHVIVDALNELKVEERQRVAEWIVALRDAFPQTPVLVCHRQYNYVPGLLPFPVVVLQKVDEDQARKYIADYLREKGGDDHESRAKNLIRMLLDSDDYKHVRDLAQTPLFLWMLVDRYRVTNALPESRGPLFDDFSRWYLEERYHEEQGEPVASQFEYEDKARVLGRLGYELVRMRETELKETRARNLAAQEIPRRSKAILAELADAQMLLREGGKLRFLHQSFQEYFAARYFLDHVGKDGFSIHERVLDLGWHDTFALLIGFGGDRPDVIRQVIEEALKVNPVLTARCLRMAESPDAALLTQFVESRERVLRDGSAGEYLHGRAAEALAEYGRGPARAAIWRVATDAAAPDAARMVCLDRLAAMPGQARFDRISSKLHKEMVDGLACVFDEPAPVGVRKGAIEAVVKAKLDQMSNYLGELVETGEWELRRAARKGCEQLGLKLTSRQQAAFAAACRERLGGVEEELAKEAVTSRFDALNEERVEILRQLAGSANLETLLERRFAYGIHEKVAKIIDEVVASERAREPGKDRSGDLSYSTVLMEEPGDVGRWFELLRSGDEVVAMAAGHRLCKVGKDLPVEAIAGLFDPSLSPRRLSAVGWIAAASEDKRFAEPHDQLVRGLIETVAGTEAMECLSNLVTALESLDRSRARRMIAVAFMVFYTRRHEATSPWVSAWMKVSSSFYLEDVDYNALIASGGDDARAAVFRLSTDGGATLRVADRPLSVRLEDNSLRQFQALAEAEQELIGRYRFALAATEVEAAALLP
jgi:Ternary complex associated domain 9